MRSIPAIALAGYGMNEDICRIREACLTTKAVDFTKLRDDPSDRVVIAFVPPGVLPTMQRVSSWSTIVHPHIGRPVEFSQRASVSSTNGT